MYRFPLTFIVASLALSSVYGQSGQSGQRTQAGSRQPAGYARTNTGAQQPVTRASEPVSAAVHQLLTDWSQSSDRIERLHGTHRRHVYDLAFQTERISTGEFGYAKPDKGRITMTPVKITKELIASRNDPKIRVQRKKDGTPFDLRPANAERWLCDGEKVYDIDEETREARVAQLPPEQRGKNIMNTPLPFLFGMPPEMAVKRFRIQIVKDYRPKFQTVALQVEPRTMADKQSWIMAQIMLDTRTYLPTAVRLTDPAKTKMTLYTFTKMNKGANLSELWRNPWDVNLSKYKVQIVNPQEKQAIAGAQQPAAPGRASSGTTAPRVFPNLKHVAHDKAEQALIAVGIPKANIKKKQAGPAPQKELIYRVSAQYPAAGKPLDPRAEVVLMIYTAPTTARGAAKPAGRSQ